MGALWYSQHVPRIPRLDGRRGGDSMLPRHGRQAQSQSHLYPDHQGGGSGGQELSSSRHQAVPRLEDQVPSSSQGQVHGQTSSSLHHCASFYSRSLNVDKYLRDIYGLKKLCTFHSSTNLRMESFLQHVVWPCVMNHSVLLAICDVIEL